MAGVAQEDDQNGDDGTENGDEDRFFADFVDPTFGYPLAADETDAVELAHVVEVTVEEEQNPHEDFPLAPSEENPDELVEVPAEFIFDPVGILIEPGDLIHFRVVAHLHTVTAFHEKYHLEEALPTRVPSGTPGFTSPPIADDESWIYQFETSGVYDYLCLPHLEFGMVGRVVVFNPDEDDIEDDVFAAPSAGPLPPNAERVFDADELTPANIVEVGSVAWNDLTL